MALATFKDLCIDATDAPVLGRFWGVVLGRDVQVLDDGDVVLRGARPTDTIWVNQVPESRTVSHRVHLDLSVGSLDPLVAAGATVVVPAEQSGFTWTIMADPEGGEFCAFVRDDRDPAVPADLFEVVVKTADAASSQALADWWADVLGGSSVDDGRGFWWIEDVASFPFETMDMVPVPDPKETKNRIHWDVTCDDVPALVARGATVLREPDQHVSWHVLADPQGNEFCVFGR